MEAIIYLNGKFIQPKDAKISALSTGFLYGFGVFETMRCLNNNIVYFDEHLERIKASCGLIGVRFSYPIRQIKAIIFEAVERGGFKDSYIKLVLWKDINATGILVIVKKYIPYSQQKYKRGFRCCISDFRQNEDSRLAALKTTNRILYELSFEQAKNNNYDEAIILNNRGYICEAARSNIFFAQNNGVFTPSIDCGCLNGITRKVVFGIAKKCKIPIVEGKFTTSDLCNADEAFLTNSGMGIMPLASVERKLINKVKRRELTDFFIRKYNSLLK